MLFKWNSTRGILYQRVVGDIPERVVADVVLPLFGWTTRNAVVEHRQGGMELADK